MRFNVNVHNFMKAIEPAVMVSTKDVYKECDGPGAINIEAKPDEIMLSANGGYMGILNRVSNENHPYLGYTCSNPGSATVDPTVLSEFLTSYPPAQHVTLSTTKERLNITWQTKIGGQYSRSPLCETVQLFEMAQEFDEAITVDRKVFISGMNQVAFAVGRTFTQMGYTCRAFEAAKDTVRFAAGDGSRFAVVDFEGKGIVEVSRATQVIFPTEVIRNIVRILSKASSRDIKIKIGKAPVDNENLRQIVIEVDSTVLVIPDFGIPDFGIPDFGIPEKYVPVNKVIDYDYPYEISSKLADWKDPAAAVKALQRPANKWGRQIVYANIAADLTLGYFNLETEGRNTAHRIIPFSLTRFVTPADCRGKRFSRFRCSSAHIKEMVSLGAESNEIIIKFQDQGEERADPDNAMKPVLVEYPEKVSKATGAKKTVYLYLCGGREMTESGNALHHEIVENRYY